MAVHLAAPQGSGPPRPDPDPEAPPGARSQGLRQVVVTVVTGLLLIALVRSFLVQGYFIPSGSMEPTLHGCSGCTDDRVLVDRLSARTDAIERGDVVVFRDSQGWLHPGSPPGALHRWLAFVGLAPDEAGPHLVKRVIGIEGDHVQARHGVLTVNGVRLVEPYVVGESSSASDFDVTVPEGKLWVMGDDRDSSADSRAHLHDPGGGFVPAGDVVGRVFAIVWPLERGGALRRPATFDQPSLDQHD